MSRIGKLPIAIPSNVEINYENPFINISGKFGYLKLKVPKIIKIEHTPTFLKLSINNNSKKSKALYGLYRTLINNMIIGVAQQFEIVLILKGVGYRANIENKIIILNLGYSHPVKIKIPDNISVDIVQNTIIHLKSCDKEKVGLFASNIRSWRYPEPYKGKGILYKDEQIIRKAGKTGK